MAWLVRLFAALFLDTRHRALGFVHVLLLVDIAVLSDERAVLGEGLQAQGAQALGQARIDQRSRREQRRVGVGS